MSSLKVKWDEMSSYDTDKFLAENENLDLPLGNKYFEVPTNHKKHNLLIIEIENGNYGFFITKFIPLKTLVKQQNFSLVSNDNFTGFIDLIDTKNNIKDLGYFIEGNLVTIDNNYEDVKSKMAVDCYEIITEHWTDWYVNGSYVDSTLDDITRETVCISDGGGSGGDGGTGGSTGGTGTGGTSNSDQTVLDTKIKMKDLSKLEANYKHLMSEAELDIYENELTLRQKFWYLSSAADATHFMSEEFPDFNCRNGMADAYRHALWNAFSTQQIGASLTETLTTAHEEIPFEYDNHYKEKKMDLFNNEKGRSIGYSSLAMKMAIDKTKNALYNGELVYLSNVDPVSCRATDRSEIVSTHN